MRGPMIRRVEPGAETPSDAPAWGEAWTRAWNDPALESHAALAAYLVDNRAKSWKSALEREPETREKDLSALRERSRVSLDAAPEKSRFARLIRKHRLGELERLILAWALYQRFRKEDVCIRELFSLADGRLEDFRRIRGFLSAGSPLLRKRLLRSPMRKHRLTGGGEELVAVPARLARWIFDEPPPAKKPVSAAEKRWERFQNASQILEALNRRVVGQDRAKRALAMAAFFHLRRLRKDPAARALNRSHVLFVGPSGCGKTFLVQSLAEELGLPYVIGDASSWSETGYVGGCASNILDELVSRVKYSPEERRFGIVFIDEIDKIAAPDPASGRRRDHDIGGRSVQEELLKMLDGVDWLTRSGGFGMEFDTRDILFVAGGAFSGLEDGASIIRPIGFAADSRAARMAPVIDVEALVDYGMLPELLGRFPARVRLDALSKEALLDILTRPETGALAVCERALESQGISRRWRAEEAERMAEEAEQMGLGARSLWTILNREMAELVTGAGEAA